MKKTPLYYLNQIVGYVDEIEYNDNGIIDFVRIYLFDSLLYTDIIMNIKKSVLSSFDNIIDDKNITNNNLYDFILNDDVIIFKLKE